MTSLSLSNKATAISLHCNYIIHKYTRIIEFFVVNKMFINLNRCPVQYLFKSYPYSITSFIISFFPHLTTKKTSGTKHFYPRETKKRHHRTKI